MMKTAPENTTTVTRPSLPGLNVCDLRYLTGLMGFKKPLIGGVIDSFLRQLPEELAGMNTAVLKNDYRVIRNFAHNMKSTISIMGISSLAPVLEEMEDLAAMASHPDSSLSIASIHAKMKLLNDTVSSICLRAIEEIQIEQLKYV